MVVCTICGKEYSSDKALIPHKWRSHTEAGLIHKNKTGKKGIPSHRKGLTKETSEEIRKTSKKIQEAFQKQVREGTYTPRKMGTAARQKLSQEQSLHNRGGKCKWFEYNGQKLQGTWELNIAKSLDSLGIRWYKPKLNHDIIKYIQEGKTKSYTPDFFLPDENLYLEIKGFWWGKDRQKMSDVITQNPDKKIIIIEKEDYEKILRGELVW